ncbi:MAG: hypothetical protein E6Q97_15315 [Desulfurellales bacterium]|nr:MAG: hypothetical protein E6Q97_15315 [Desulfurellales bacterium]
MGINAMESQTIETQDASGLGKVFNVGLVFIVGFALLFGVAYGVKWLYGWYSTPAPVAALIEKATSADEYRNYCFNGECVKVKMCTAISAECGDMTQGPKANYGTGFHTSADGRQRPNPPAGWKWAGK